MDIIHVGLVDAQPMFRKGVVKLLNEEPDIVVVGEAATGYEAVTLVQDLQPELVLMDLELPELSGIRTVQQILLCKPATKIIILSAQCPEEELFSAIKYGVRGYILKDAAPVELRQAIWAVAQGGAVITPTVAIHVLQTFQQCWPRTGPVSSLPEPDQKMCLTDRELAILRGMVEGRSNKEIGIQLGFAEKTIRNSVSNLFQKLNVRDRAQASAYAVRHGLTTQP